MKFMIKGTLFEIQIVNGSAPEEQQSFYEKEEALEYETEK